MPAGLYLPAKQFEPYPAGAGEYCGVCNYTEVFGAPSTWGWADSLCTNTFISMCRLQSEKACVPTPSPACTLLLMRIMYENAALTATASTTCADPGPQPKFVSPTSGVTYLLNTVRTNFTAAEQYCNDNGGHLIAYGNSFEQTEVEQFFITQGLLFSECHLSYWIGLKADQWPNFYWTDRWGRARLAHRNTAPAFAYGMRQGSSSPADGTAPCAAAAGCRRRPATWAVTATGGCSRRISPSRTTARGPSSALWPTTPRLTATWSGDGRTRTARTSSRLSAGSRVCCRTACMCRLPHVCSQDRVNPHGTPKPPNLCFDPASLMTQQFRLAVLHRAWRVHLHLGDYAVPDAGDRQAAAAAAAAGQRAELHPEHHRHHDARCQRHLQQLRRPACGIQVGQGAEKQWRPRGPCDRAQACR